MKVVVRVALLPLTHHRRGCRSGNLPDVLHSRPDKAVPELVAAPFVGVTEEVRGRRCYPHLLCGCHGVEDPGEVVDCITAWGPHIVRLAGVLRTVPLGGLDDHQGVFQFHAVLAAKGHKHIKARSHGSVEGEWTKHTHRQGST